MHLGEGPGEGGLAALVRAGDDDDPLLPLQTEVVDHHARLRPHQLMGQGQVEEVDGHGRPWFRVRSG